MKEECNHNEFKTVLNEDILNNWCYSIEVECVSCGKRGYMSTSPPHWDDSAEG